LNLFSWLWTRGSLRSARVAPHPHRRRRLFIDLSEVVKTDYGTGIHRVVRNLTRSLLASTPQESWSMVPVMHHEDGQWAPASAYVHESLGMECPASAWPPSLKPDDVLLMLDSAWERPERFLESTRAVQAAGGQAGAFVYDLIPLRYPRYCVDFMPPIFERWLRFVVEQSDFLVCISRSVADDLHAWILESKASVGRGLRIGHVHLGSGIDELRGPAAPSAQAVEAMQGGNSVLMVGTIEPRKRHALALEAFELAWQRGSRLRLVLMGKEGWNVQEFMARMVGHAEFNKRLFWIDRPSDGDLAHAYANARSLLQASDVEGFGLPIVEAAHHGTPLLLSDIPVFREIAGHAADYFTPGDSQELAGWLSPACPTPRPSSPGIAIAWRESASRLLTLLQGNSWDHLLPADRVDGSSRAARGNA